MGINWTGPWVNSTSYNIDDAVSYLGSSYVAAFANTGVTPPNTPANSTVWNLLAAAGSVTLSSVPQSFIWQGAYSALTAYYSYDCVSFNGSSYICLANGVLDQEPDVSPSYWDLLAEGGSGGGGGGGDTWGDITGTLSNQTDLQTVLNSKANATVITLPDLTTVAGGVFGTAAFTAASAYDAAGAAATAQANAEAYASNASNLSSGTVAAARLPVALSSSTSVNGTAIPASATLLTTVAAASTYAPIFTLTTTGSSGAATYSGNTLNIPQYAAGFITSLTTTGSSGAATVTSGVLNIPQYAGGGSMTWPGAAGIAVYAGSSAWGTSLTAPAGTIVGTTDTQTLTNKTIDGVTPTTMGYLDATSSIQTQLNGKQSTLTLTTTGSSGAATLTGGTLNIPQYSGGTGASFVDSEVVSGSTGTTFTLAHTPVSGSLHLFRSGVRMYPTTDYTISGVTVTTNYSTTAGALIADYLQSSGTINFADSEVVAGSTGTTFTLAHTPVSGSLHLFRSGIRMGSSDYSISGATITMTYSTTVGTLLADYRY